MVKAVIIDNPGAGNHDYGWRRAFGEGLSRRGWQVVMSNNFEPCDLFVIWGVRRADLIERARSFGAEICVLERGYLADRFTWTSVSFGGGLNGRGVFRTPHGADISRFNSLGVQMPPWYSPDHGYALIMGQVPGDQSIRGVDIDAFYRTSAQSLRAAGHHEIYFRDHPRGRGRDVGLPVKNGDLHDAIDGAKIVVTFNSNSGVDAVLRGRPVVAVDRGSMVWDIAGHAVADDVMILDRSAWASRLAWCQFTRQEMQTGFCAEAVGL